MTSYNKVNGTYVNSSELINIILRNEFSFNGLIMTDQDIVAKDCAQANEVINAGNDLIMLGNKYQFDTLLKAIQDNKVDKRKLQESVSRILKISKDLTK